ncbi:uncharacterized protein TNCV_485871 [Trichonephila clavipes]|nr:uncharacterized protein TNCV_485871 [Trichonephila clavipes]
MKPSQLLRKMKSLAGVNISKKVLRTLWLDKLPDSIKNILVISSENLENLSVMADKIFEINSSPEIYSAMKNILDKVSLLEQRISELSINRRNSRSEFKNCNHTRNKSRSRSRKHFNPNRKCCYFHFVFGNKCYPDKCKSPCSWNKASENLEEQ